MREDGVRDEAEEREGSKGRVQSKKKKKVWKIPH